MLKSIFKDSSPFVKILFSLFAILFGFTVFMIIGMLFSMIFFGTGLSAFGGKLDPLNPQNLPVLKFLQVCFSVGLFVFPPFIVALFVHGKIAEYLKLNKKPTVNGLIISIILVLFSMPLINFLVMLNENINFPESLKAVEGLFKKMENDAQTISMAFLKASGFGQYLVNIFVIALVPAVGEELMFRGIFQRLFNEWIKNIHVAIFTVAFIFSAMHMQFYGFSARLALGILFGYLFYWSGNLWLPIIAHFVNNSFAVTVYFLKSDLAQKAESFGTGKEMIPSVIFSVVSIVLLLYLIYKDGKHRNDSESIIDASDK